MFFNYTHTTSSYTYLLPLSLRSSLPICIEVLINNAGITQPGNCLEIGPNSWDRILDVKLRGVLYLSQAVVPHMRGKGGAIACMSSVSAQRGGGIFGGPHYSAAKAGVLGLAKAMAREFGPDNMDRKSTRLNSRH